MIPEEKHEEIYGKFYKEIGVNDISEAVLKVGYGKDFARRFKQSNTYMNYLSEKQREKDAKQHISEQYALKRAEVKRRDELILHYHERGFKPLEIAEITKLERVIVYGAIARFKKSVEA